MSSTDDVSSELFKKSYLLPILTIIISLLLGAAEAGGGGSGEETPWPLWELLIVFGIPIITCLIAKARGRGPVRWFFISLLLPVLGLIILLCMSNLKLGRRVMSSPTPLKCDLGKGETQDDAQAAEWYREAAEQGHVEAEKAENEAKAEARAEEAEARAEASLNKTFIVTYRSTKKGGLIKGHSKMKALFASFDNTEEIEAKTKKEAKEKFKNMNKGILSPQTIVSIEEK